MTLLAAVVAALSAAAPAPGTEESRPMAALAEMVRAVNAGDARAYAALYAPDALLTIYGGDVLQGRSVTVGEGRSSRANRPFHRSRDDL